MTSGGTLKLDRPEHGEIGDTLRPGDDNRGGYYDDI